MSVTIVFVLSQGHSGSTLLDLLLGAHGQGFSLGEFGLLQWPNYRRKKFGQSLCGICQSSCPIWDSPGMRSMLATYFPMGDSGKSSLLQRMKLRARSVHKDIAGFTGSSFLVDSSKNVEWITRMGRYSPFRSKVGLRLVYLERDGRAVVNSVRRKYAERPFESIVKSWKQNMYANEKFYSSTHLPKCRVSYEELCQEPVRVMNELFDFIGVPFDDTVVRFREQDAHLIGGNRGTRSQLRLEGGSECTAARSTASLIAGNDEIEGISLDEKWKTELTAQQLGVFDRVHLEVD